MRNGENSEASLQSEMQLNGFNPHSICLDGSIQRFSKTGETRKQNCWLMGWQYSLSNGKQCTYAIYGDWKSGERHVFNSRQDFSVTEMNEAKEKQIELTKNFEIKKKGLQDGAAKNAKRIWAKSKTVRSHPYLLRKKISNLGQIRQLGRSLVIPMSNIEGELVGLQFIDPQGNKRFLKGQKVKGCFFIIGDEFSLKKINEIRIVEGVATGISVYTAERKAVLCVFSAKNIESVCEIIRSTAPLIKIKICADNDQFTVGNPGVTHGSNAAIKYNALFIKPTFEENTGNLSDFNDVHCHQGINAVRTQLANANYFSSEAPPESQLAENYLSARNLKFENKPTLVFWQDSFFKFETNCYQPLTDPDLFADVMAFLQSGSGARKKSTTSTANNVISNLKGLAHPKRQVKMPCWLDDPSKQGEDYISFTNGIFDVKSWLKGDLRPIESHTPEFFSTICLPYALDLNAICPTWNKFLEEVQPDLTARKTLQQWFGYNLVHDCSFHKFLIMYGEGANGKSVVCTVLKAMLGDANVSSVPLEAFDPMRTFALAQTVGKLANIVGELNSTDKTAEGELKKFVAGDLMTAERKFKNPFTFTPTARLTFATNVLPRFTDTTDGIWRRIIILSFDVQIIDETKQDKNLVNSKWWLESGELPGILNWALEGLKELFQNRKFAESENALQTKENYRKDSNPTRTFLDEYFEESSESIISSYDIYKLYQEVFATNRSFPLGPQKFAEEVRRAFRSAKYSAHARARTTLNKIINEGPDRSRYWTGIKKKEANTHSTEV